MLPELTHYMKSQWHNLNLPYIEPEAIDYLGIPGSIQGGTTTFLAFSHNVKEPMFVVKINRYRKGAPKLLEEKNILNYLNLSSDKECSFSSAPKVILYTVIDGVEIIVQSVLRGKPMMAVMRPDGYPELKSAENNITLASGWLLNFNNYVKGRVDFKSELFKEYLEYLVNDFVKIFSPSPEEKLYLKVALREIVELVIKENIVGIKHGDFCRHNILVENKNGKDTIGIIDWTFSRQKVMPINDLFFFLSTYFLQLRTHAGIGGFLNAFETTYFTKNSYSEIVEKCIKKYCQSMNIDLDKVKALFVFFLVEQALFEHGQIVQCAEYGGLPRFAVYLASFENKCYQDALKEQLWSYYFHMFIKHRNDFII